MATARVQTAAEVAAHGMPPPAPVPALGYQLTRPDIVGPDTPQPPFPIRLSGSVQRGFGRGGKDLGCPTANLPDDSIAPLSSVARTGVYYGYAQVISPKGQDTSLREADAQVLPMVMSLGWNPFYGNKQLTAEIHIIHAFTSDFYGYEMRAVVLGYIRPELDYRSREALIDDIETDKRVAINCLKRPAYQKFETDPHFKPHTANM